MRIIERADARTVIVWGGKRCIYQTLEEEMTATRGLCRLDRDQVGTVVNYYVRLGIRQDGVAAGGACKFKRLRDAKEYWLTAIVSERVFREPINFCPGCQKKPQRKPGGGPLEPELCLDCEEGFEADGDDKHPRRGRDFCCPEYAYMSTARKK